MDFHYVSGIQVMAGRIHHNQLKINLIYASIQSLCIPYALRAHHVIFIPLPNEPSVSVHVC